MNISPSYYNYLHNERISISNFVKDINFNAHVEATYIVLDCYERQLIINKANIEYLIETTTISKNITTSGGENSIREVKLNTPYLVKEILWSLNRADSIDKFNNVYQAEDIMGNKINPKIIAKYVKTNETYNIPEFNI